MNTIDAITHMSMSILMSTATGLENGSLRGKSAPTGVKTDGLRCKVPAFEDINCKNKCLLSLIAITMRSSQRRPNYYRIHFIMASSWSQNGPNVSVKWVFFEYYMTGSVLMSMMSTMSYMWA